MMEFKHRALSIKQVVAATITAMIERTGSLAGASSGSGSTVKDSLTTGGGSGASLIKLVAGTWKSNPESKDTSIRPATTLSRVKADSKADSSPAVKP